MAKVRLNIDPVDKIILRRKLNKNGDGQRFFTHEVRRLSDPYVPRRTGVMKNTAIEQINKITYPQPYSRRQYYEHKGDGLIGPQWDKRMWNDRGEEIIKATAKYCGGKAK